MDMWRRATWVVISASLSVALLIVSSALGNQNASKDSLRASPQDLQWWRDAKFGMFIHWGPVSLTGKEISWSRGGERRGHRTKRNPHGIPVEVYDNLYKRFNPTKFNAREWVAIAKAAGMRYIVFTTKHHDGFCMFDSKFTNYKITKSPFGRDVTAELARACHEAGIRLGFYYSPPDWHHPDYRTKNHKRYIEYLHGQLRELCTNYGRVDIIWFDGLGGTAKDWDAERLFKMIRTLQPHVLINNRGGLPGDFDTPEQRIGHFRMRRPWESCITLGTQWAWKPNDRIKSLKECIDILVRCAGGNGNLLLNVGPMPTGEIEPRQVKRLKEIGAWLKRYGEAIYATRGGPFRPTAWGASTHRGNRIYVHILKWINDVITLPPIQKRIVRSYLLGGGTVTVDQTDKCIQISVPAVHRKTLDTIVVLELDGPASEVKVGKLASGSLAFGKHARASNVFRNMVRDYGPDKALDDDPDTRWATDWGIHQAWLEVDLGKPVMIGSAFISEAYDRVRAFELQYKDATGRWVSLAHGNKIGEHLTIKFKPVTARFVRLLILRAVEGPTIWEFQIFPPK